jgi:hypothetical protein
MLDRYIASKMVGLLNELATYWRNPGALLIALKGRVLKTRESNT